MSSEARVPLPRTAVAIGIEDPVEKARAELKAALIAIEEKANIPRRAAIAVDRAITKAQAFSRDSPALAAAAVIGVAAGVGAAVWGAVRLYIR